MVSSVPVRAEDSGAALMANISRPKSVLTCQNLVVQRGMYWWRERIANVRHSRSTKIPVARRWEFDLAKAVMTDYRLEVLKGNAGFKKAAEPEKPAITVGAWCD